MGFDLGSLVIAVVSVLLVGLVLGAGIPLVYALGIRSLESRRPGSTALAVACMVVCALLAVAGIVMIVFGDEILGG